MVVSPGNKNSSEFYYCAPSTLHLGSISAALSSPDFVPPREEMSVGSFSRTAAGNRTYVTLKGFQEMVCQCQYFHSFGALMVSVLDSDQAPSSSPGRDHCVVFLGKTLYCHGASLHPGV